MVKAEAIEKMKAGVKITHNAFSSDEWIYQIGSTIISEEGYEFPEYLFWMDRTDPAWDDGYSVWIDESIEVGLENKN
jgi:hypothetical protein